MAKSKTLLDLYKEILQNRNRSSSLHKGDKVKLNVSEIKAHPDYDKLNPRYKEFVEHNFETVFVVGCDSDSNRIKDTVSLVGDPNNWLFWIGDLIKVE